MRKLDNFRSNLVVLRKAPSQDLENEFVRSGIADKFMIQFELSWKLIKELLAYEGDALASTGSPREILKGAYRCFDFVDEDEWLSMLRDRNMLMHTYDDKELNRILHKILNEYIPQFNALEQAVLARYGAELDSLP